ncbi:transposase [Aeromonas salmonicida]|uniref:transposase n=1 Tax=Aeromonas salmonicida TaxID=645 RepID=UPI003B501605
MFKRPWRAAPSTRWRWPSSLLSCTPDHSLTLFDKGFYSLGLLHAWQTTGNERTGCCRSKRARNTRWYASWGVRVNWCSSRPHKKWPQLPDTVEARLLTRSINGKERQVLTSMVDPMGFPSADIVELYSHRREIELGYREMEHSLQQH